MCNTCSNYSGGCYNYTQASTGTGCYARTGCGSGCGYNQRICRDCCGNIWVRQNVSPCCHGCNHCLQNGCGNNGNISGNANGTAGNGYGCVTVCGRLYQGATAQTIPATTQNCAGDVDWYYARQYGGYPYGSSCCCGRGITTATTVTDAMQ